MKFTLLLASLFAGASAFAPAKDAAKASGLSATKADLEAIAAKANPIVKFYDPLNLADKDFWGFGNEATIGFLRQSEIKHGRIAMFAFVGYIVQSNFVFPWPQTLAGAAHPAASLGPEAQWDAIPLGAKWQIFAVISALELWDEYVPTVSHNIGKKLCILLTLFANSPTRFFSYRCGGGTLPHYMKGRQPGKYPSFQLFRDSVHPVLDLYDPFGFNKKMSPETKERRLIAELNNGRLAQIGILGFLSADKVAGSVPLLEPIAVPYSGEVMAPLAADFSYLAGPQAFW